MKILSKTEILESISQLSYEQINEVITEAEKIQDSKYSTYSKQQDEKYRKNKKIRENAKKKFLKETYPKILKFVKENINEGDIVKFSKTRGSGWREVITVHGESILGLVLRQNYQNKSFSRTTYSADNSLEGFAGFIKEGEFISIKEVI